MTAGRLPTGRRRTRRHARAATAMVLNAMLVGATLAACGDTTPGPVEGASTAQHEPDSPPRRLDVPTSPPDGGSAPEAARPASSAAAATSTAPVTPSSRDEHAEVGGLVPGFPSELLPLPPDAVVLVTSAVPVGTGDVREVSLNVRTRMPVDDVVRWYRKALTAAGFDEVDLGTDTETPVAGEVRFVRSAGDELVSISASATDGATTVSIGGRVRDEAHDRP